MTAHPILHIPVPRFPEAEPQRGDSIRAWAVALRLSYPDDPEGVVVDAAMIAEFVMNGGGGDWPAGDEEITPKPSISATDTQPAPAEEITSGEAAATESQGSASPRAGLPAGSGCDEIPAVLPVPAPVTLTTVPMDGYEAAKAGHPLRANPHTEEVQALAWADAWWRHHRAIQSTRTLLDEAARETASSAPRAAARNPFTEIRPPAAPSGNDDSAPCQDDAAAGPKDAGRGAGASNGTTKPGAPRAGLLRVLDAIAHMVGQGTLHPRVPEVAALSGVPASSVSANMSHLRNRGWIETTEVDGQKITRITDAAPPVLPVAEGHPAASSVSPGPVLADASVAQGEGHPSVPSGPEVQAPGDGDGQEQPAVDGREPAKARKPSPVSIPSPPVRVKPRSAPGVTSFPLGAVPKAAPVATALVAATAPAPRSEEERQIAEFVARKGVRRYEPGTLANIIAATLRQEGIEARLSGAIGSPKCAWLVTINGKEQSWSHAKTLARANEIRLSAGLEPLGRPAPDAVPAAKAGKRKNAA
ncbi:hypothetical protein [Oceanibaculum nanhaiense]|uniref:hypothetical protein n=1 Tax=Oceanibaculum nanhaiense TaxID=1909734 RepID=UPI003D28B07C